VATVSGFGRDSAYRDKVAFDLIAQAYSGVLAMTGPPEGPPMPIGTSLADVMAGVHAVAGIGLALYHRERTGTGQHIDISMVDALFHAHEVAVQGPPLTNMKWKPRRGGAKSAINAPMGVFRAPQGWIALHVMQAQWPGFCRAIGRPDLEHDERFADLRGRHKNRQDLNDLIEAWMATKDSDAEILALLEAQRVPCAPVIEPYQAIGHPYFESRRMIRRIPDPILGEVVIPGNPIRMSAHPEDLDLVAPLLGQHNAEVLAELGYADADIEALVHAGVLRQGDR
jgi:CoA:oxalate CoA-transferase